MRHHRLSRRPHDTTGPLSDVVKVVGGVTAGGLRGLRHLAA
jgi:hypothetical protein